MKQSIALTLVLALALAAVPALAGEEPAAPAAAGDLFQAFRALPAGEQAQLVALDEAQLAAIEGGQNDVCLGCVGGINIPAVLVSPGTTIGNVTQGVQTGG